MPNRKKADIMNTQSTAVTTVTVDIVLLRLVGSTLETLLIERRKDPFAGMWALPGGKLNSDDDSLRAAALRELREETGIQNVPLHQVSAFGDHDRDPRGRYISVTYVAFQGDEQQARAGDDAAEACWHGLAQLPPLAFDHDLILLKVCSWLAHQLASLSDILHVLPTSLTLAQVQAMRHAIDARLTS